MNSDLLVRTFTLEVVFALDFLDFLAAIVGRLGRDCTRGQDLPEFGHHRVSHGLKVLNFEGVRQRPAVNLDAFPDEIGESKQ